MDGVGKVFAGGVTALSDMNLSVTAGEFVSLLGPSGCGKSTALRLIAGLMQPTTGKVRWQGAHDTGDLGVVFQEPTLMPWATVERNVWLPLRLKGEGLPDARPRIAAALDEITRNRMNDDLLALRGRLGCTVIFVTHSVFESVYLSDRIVVMAPRPGRVAEELTVTAPRRDEDFRTSAEYAALCRAVSASLSRATGDA